MKAINVTKKGKITIPKKLREKYRITDKIVLEEIEKCIVIKPIFSPEDEFGSLKGAFGGKKAKELLEESRKEEYAQNQKWNKKFKVRN